VWHAAPTPSETQSAGTSGSLPRRACWPHRPRWPLGLLALVPAAGLSLLACSPREGSDSAVDEASPRAGFEIRETDQGVEVRDGGDLVLFYQRALKDHEGQYARSNYVHPLMSLDGDVLTEDFPEDHLHQRGIFWAWHQLWDGEERLGDGWTLEDFTTDVDRVETGVSDGTARVAAEVKWRSPRFRDGEPFVEEHTAITIHPIVGDARAGATPSCRISSVRSGSRS
jgi:hypothetical protein